MQRSAFVGRAQIVFHKAARVVAEAEIVDRHGVVRRAFAGPGVHGGSFRVPARPSVFKSGVRTAAREESVRNTTWSCMDDIRQSI